MTTSAKASCWCRRGVSSGASQALRACRGKTVTSRSEPHRGLQRQQLGWDRLVARGRRRVLAQRRRGDNHALREATLAGEREEVSQVAHLDRRFVEVALDRTTPLPILLLGHRVNPRVRGVL